MSDDLSLDLDTVAAQTAPEPTPADEDPPWVDVPSAWTSPYYAATGARSDDLDAWHRARRTGIGASEIAMVLGESRWGDAGTVYARKVAAPKPEPREWLEWGLRLEAVIADAYSSPRYANRPVQRDGRLLRSRAHPWAIATLDGWTEIDGRRAVWECKTTRFAEDWTDGPPREYVLQLQHQMLVTGAELASIVVLIGGSQLAWCDVARDEMAIARIIRAGERFWRQLEAREMPETRDHDALASVFAEEERGRVVELAGADWVIADAKRCEASAVAVTAERERRDIDAKIKRAMGRAAIARLDDGTEYRWTTQRDGRRVLRRKEAVIG